jgi:two-component system sporulation sensor kinase A
VRVRARAEEREVVLEVDDDGPGLSSEVQQHLFEPFFTTKPNGTGLGLPTSRRFIEAHGGVIEAARSAAMGGALFRLRLPLGAADAPAAQPTEAPHP